jgi:hypothetical protein
METRTGRLRARWLVLVLGGILLATTVLFGPVTNAGAQGQSQAKGKAQGQSQGKGKSQDQVKGQVQGADEAEGGDEGEGEDEAEGGGGQPKVTLCHKGKNTITVGAPAVEAHLAHGDNLDACDDSGAPVPPPPTPGDCDLADNLDFVSQSDGGDAALVDAGDQYLLPGENLTLTTEPTIAVTDADETPHTFNNTNATITEETAGIRIVVTQSAPVELQAGADLTIEESTQGIECGKVTAIGALTTTPSGDVALRTKGSKGDPKVLPLVAQTKSKEDKLEKLAASKLGKVKVTGVKVKVAKEGAKKVKGQKQKEALKVTSVKQTNKK